MEEPLIDPSVDQAFKAIKEKIGGPITCPCCGNTEWSVPKSLVASVGLWDSDPDADVSGEDPSGGWAVHRVLWMACAKCAFIQQHFVPVEPSDEEVPEAT